MIGLSLFDGKSSAYTACELAGINLDKFYSAEIDKYAIQVSNAIHPDQVRLGDVVYVEKALRWKDSTIEKALKSKWLKKGRVKLKEALPIRGVKIDMIFGGFPCQAWSMAGKQLGDKDKRGKLFWTMLDIMKHVKSKNPDVQFLIENVKMKKEFEEYITHHMTEAVGGVHKILINSALVSAQNRNRYYWTSFPVTQPEDRGIVLADIVEGDGHACGAFRGRYIVNGKRGDHLVSSMAGRTEQRLEVRKDNKTNALTTVQKDNQIVRLSNCNRVAGVTEDDRGYRPYRDREKKGGITEIGRILKKSAKSSDAVTARYAPSLSANDDADNLMYRKLTPRECFRLQTTPEFYINLILECGVSNTQLYKIAGNGWTDEVIAHILRCMPIKKSSNINRIRKLLNRV